MEYKDYYKLLGVSRTATEKEIKSAYRKMARKYHPDATGGDDEKFKDLNEAYEVLKDPQKRRRYDSLGADWKHGSRFEPPPGWNTGRGAGGGPYQQQVNMEDLFGQGGFSSFFESMFGGGAGPQGDPFGGYSGHPNQQARQHHAHRQQQYQEPPTQPVEMNLPLTLEEVMTGCEKAVSLPHKGQSVTVNIPQGVKVGTKIRLANQGQRTPTGRFGDLHMLVSYKKHPTYAVENGIDLVADIAVPVATLVLGGQVTVPVLKGGSVSVKVPAGSQGGQKLRLRGQGLPNKGKAMPGDLFVRLLAKIPKELTAEQRTHYEALKKIDEAVKLD